MISVKGLKLEIGISMKDILHCIDLGEPYEHIFQNPFYHVIVKDNESKQKISFKSEKQILQVYLPKHFQNLGEGILMVLLVPYF